MEIRLVRGPVDDIICVHNVVAASAVVGLLGREGSVIRKTLVPFFYYALLPGAIGYCIVWYSQLGLFNIGTVIAAAILLSAILTIAINCRCCRSKSA